MGRDAIDADKDVVVVAASGGYPHYLRYAAYFCQPGRTFRDVARMGFYADGEIKPEIPRILARRDHVSFDHATVRALHDAEAADDVRIGWLIDRLLRDGVLPEGAVEQVFLLSPAGDERTVVLPRPIRNTETAGSGRSIGWLQGQRYASLAALPVGPATTEELARLEG